ncbi:MAG: glycoside hydrolase family 9 protein [Oscillospiraceae bacterium]|nr:glycoside hydrolase family 9 protein [Oscillospiraceae bacterium]
MRIKNRISALVTAFMVAATASIPVMSPQVATAATNYVNYAEALQKSLYLYDANMCGTGVDENSGLEWRTDCHVGDATYNYNGKILDLSGGFHDAGDHVKFGLPEAYSLFTLGFNYYYFKDAFTQTGTDDHLQRITDYGADYFKRCTVYNGTEVEAFAYTVGNGGEDHSYWGSPEAQEASEGTREAFFATASNPGTDCVSLAAAALAINYLNFGNEEDLQVAKDLFAFADKNTKAVATMGNNEGVGGSFYKSTNWADDYSLAATVLNIATGDESYKAKAESIIDPKQNVTIFGEADNGYHYSEYPYAWDGVYHAVHALRNDLQYSYQMTWGNENYDFATTIDNVVKKYPTTTKGFTFISEWASARYNASLQLMGLIYDQETGSDKYGTWAQGQMDYIFGNNEFGKCLMVGYNDISSSHPHHRAASSPAYGDSVENETKGGGQLDQSHILYGALCGGPTDANGSYQDTATDYVANEVTLDYNAAFVGALAGLYLKYGQDDQPIDESTLLEIRDLSGGGGNEDVTPPVITENNETAAVIQTLEVNVGDYVNIKADELVTWTIDSEDMVDTIDNGGDMYLFFRPIIAGTIKVTATDRAGNETTIDIVAKAVETDPPTVALYGDVDGDESIGKMADVVLLAKFFNGSISLNSSALANANCDNTGNSAGKVDSSDLSALVGYLLGTVSSLPVS